MKELRARDLRQPDCRDVAGVAVEMLIHLFINALRLQRNFIEMRFAEHVAFSMGAFPRPGAAVRQFSRRLPLRRNIAEQLQRRVSVRDDAEIGIEDAADLRRLDIDVNELPAFRVGLDGPRVTVRPAVADPEREIRPKERRIRVTVACLQTHHSRHERMIVRD